MLQPYCEGTLLDYNLDMLGFVAGYVGFRFAIINVKHATRSFGLRIYYAQFCLWFLIWGHMITYLGGLRQIALLEAMILLVFLLAAASARVTLLILILSTVEYFGCSYYAIMVQNQSGMIGVEFTNLATYFLRALL